MDNPNLTIRYSLQRVIGLPRGHWGVTRLRAHHTITEKIGQAHPAEEPNFPPPVFILSAATCSLHWYLTIETHRSTDKESFVRKLSSFFTNANQYSDCNSATAHPICLSKRLRGHAFWSDPIIWHTRKEPMLCCLSRSRCRHAKRDHNEHLTSLDFKVVTNVKFMRRPHLGARL